MFFTAVLAMKQRQKGTGMTMDWGDEGLLYDSI